MARHARRDARLGKGRAKAPSQRQLRAGELIRHALVDILAREDFEDPELHGRSITVSEVRCSPDLRHATLFVAPLGMIEGDPEAEAETIAKALNRARGFLRGRLGREIDLKFTPELHFEPDRSFAEARRIESLLARDDVRRDLSEDDHGDEDDNGDSGLAPRG